MFLVMESLEGRDMARQLAFFIFALDVTLLDLDLRLMLHYTIFSCV